MSTHIALLGASDDQILTSLRYFSGISRLYILHSPNTERFPFADYAADLKRKLKEVKFVNVVLAEIDAFNMQSVIDTIIRIAETETDSDLYVNVTGGTNLMAAAASIAAFSVGAKGYYVLDEEKLKLGQKTPIVELPMPAIPLTRGLQGTQLQVLKKIRDLGGKASSTELRDDLGLSAQTLSYHVKQLRKKGLVVSRRGTKDTQDQESGLKATGDSRCLMIEITNAGRLIVNISL